jgi:hypothetical protein
MGVLIITVTKNEPSKDSTDSEDYDDHDDDNKKNTLKLLTFILYYAYYNTFEDPLNEHLYKQILDTSSEKSSMSFNVTLGEMLKVINKQSESIEEDEDKNLTPEEKQNKLARREKNNKLIANLSDLMAHNLEGDLFEGFELGKIKRAKEDLIKQQNTFITTTITNNSETSTGTNSSVSKYDEEKSKLYRLINQEKYMIIILALKTISTTVEGHNTNLKHRLQLESEIYEGNYYLGAPSTSSITSLDKTMAGMLTTVKTVLPSLTTIKTVGMGIPVILLGALSRLTSTVLDLHKKYQAKNAAARVAAATASAAAADAAEVDAELKFMEKIANTLDSRADEATHNSLNTNIESSNAVAVAKLAAIEVLDIARRGGAHDDKLLKQHATAATRAAALAAAAATKVETAVAAANITAADLEAHSKLTLPTSVTTAFAADPVFADKINAALAKIKAAEMKIKTATSLTNTDKKAAYDAKSIVTAALTIASKIDIINGAVKTAAEAADAAQSGTNINDIQDAVARANTKKDVASAQAAAAAAAVSTLSAPFVSADPNAATDLNAAAEDVRNAATEADKLAKTANQHHTKSKQSLADFQATTIADIATILGAKDRARSKAQDVLAKTLSASTHSNTAIEEAKLAAKEVLSFARSKGTGNADQTKTYANKVEPESLLARSNADAAKSDADEVAAAHSEATAALTAAMKNNLSATGAVTEASTYVDAAKLDVEKAIKAANDASDANMIAQAVLSVADDIAIINEAINDAKIAIRKAKRGDPIPNPHSPPAPTPAGSAIPETAASALAASAFDFPVAKAAADAAVLEVQRQFEIANARAITINTHISAITTNSFKATLPRQLESAVNNVEDAAEKAKQLANSMSRYTEEAEQHVQAVQTAYIAFTSGTQLPKPTPLLRRRTGRKVHTNPAQYAKKTDAVAKDAAIKVRAAADTAIEQAKHAASQVLLFTNGNKSNTLEITGFADSVYKSTLTAVEEAKKVTSNAAAHTAAAGAALAAQAAAAAAGDADATVAADAEATTALAAKAAALALAATTAAAIAEARDAEIIASALAGIVHAFSTIKDADATAATAIKAIWPRPPPVSTAELAQELVKDATRIQVKVNAQSEFATKAITALKADIETIDFTNITTKLQSATDDVTNAVSNTEAKATTVFTEHNRIVRGLVKAATEHLDSLTPAPTTARSTTPRGIQAAATINSEAATAKSKRETVLIAKNKAREALTKISTLAKTQSIVIADAELNMGQVMVNYRTATASASDALVAAAAARAAASLPTNEPALTTDVTAEILDAEKDTLEAYTDAAATAHLTALAAYNIIKIYKKLLTTQEVTIKGLSTDATTTMKTVNEVSITSAEKTAAVSEANRLSQEADTHIANSTKWVEKIKICVSYANDAAIFCKAIVRTLFNSYKFAAPAIIDSATEEINRSTTTAEDAAAAAERLASAAATSRDSINKAATEIIKITNPAKNQNPLTSPREELEASKLDQPDKARPGRVRSTKISALPP